jgi:hypothetical protein
MAWPFSNVNQPNLDTGPGVAVPTSSTSITASEAWLLGAHFTNSTAGQITVTVTNTAGSILCKIKIPANAEQPYEWPFRPVSVGVGVKWFASGAGLLGHIWGYV